VGPGATFTVSGTQFNGFSQGAAYGDDAQMATNYPLVRITNTGSGHVFYARTHDHSSMGVEAVGAVDIRSTKFDTPSNLELGLSTLVVVTNGIPSLPVNIDVRAATSLAITGATSGEFDDPATVQAQLLSNGAPVPGKTVDFAVGAATCSGVTDGSGFASCPLTPNQMAGSYTLTATFAADTSYAGSSASATFTVTKEQATLVFSATSATVIANGHPATFSAVLKEDGITPISGRSIVFTLGAQSCPGTTDGTGTATCTILVNQPLGPSSVSAVFAGDPFYLPSSSSEAVLLFAFLDHGSMIVGNLNAATGSAVEFWGAQWAGNNALSGGSAPNAFKGFASISSQSCGGTWTSSPGDSSGPPAAVPSYMGVIASSSISQSGSSISGNVPMIVVVKTNPGYGPSPGQPGTGTVVAVFCH